MTTQKYISTMTRKEILAVKPREDYRTPALCSGFVIIPTRRKHDSGYKQMEVVAFDEHGYPICKCSVSCDVINLLNYNRYGISMKSPVMQDEIVYRWHIDCLPKSGVLCFSTFDGKQTEIGIDCSSIDIEGYEKKEVKE